MTREKAVTAEADETWSIVEGSVRKLFDDRASALDDTERDFVRIGPYLDELGWSDIAAEYPVDAWRLLLTTQARTLAQTEILGSVLLAELAEIVPHDPRAVVVLPPVVAGTATGSTPESVRGLVLGDLPGSGPVAVPLTAADGEVGVAVVDAGELVGRRLPTFDPTVRWTEVTGAVGGQIVPAGAQWRRAVSAAHRALATELVALAQEELRIAVEHATARTQFGSRITSFQVIRHDLADCYVRIAGARALLDESWRYGGRMSGLAAKISAGRTHRHVANVTTQVCGAIGVTAEFGLHRYVRRGLQLDGLFGSSAQLTSAMRSRLFDGVDPPTPALPSVIAG